MTLQSGCMAAVKDALGPPTCVLLVHGLEGVGRFGAGAGAYDEQAGRHRVQRPRVAHLQGTGVCFWQNCDTKQVGCHWERWLRETYLQRRSDGLLNQAKVEQGPQLGATYRSGLPATSKR